MPDETHAPEFLTDEHEVMLRRISPTLFFQALGEVNTLIVRPTEQDDEGLSMYMSSRRSPESLRGGSSAAGVFAATVGDLHGIGLTVQLDEVGPDKGPGHCLIPEIRFRERRTPLVKDLMNRLAHLLYRDQRIVPTRPDHDPLHGEN